MYLSAAKIKTYYLVCAVFNFLLVESEGEIHIRF